MSLEAKAGMAAEVLLEERRVAARPAVPGFFREFFGTDQDAKDGTEGAERLRGILAEAVPYYWAAEQCRIVERVGRSVPLTWTPLAESFETTAGFFWFARCFGIAVPKSLRVDLRAVAWRLEPDALWLVWYCETNAEAGTVPMGLMRWQLHQSLGEALEALDALAPPGYREDGTLSAQAQWVRFSAAAFAFLEQRILLTRRVRPARAVRRRLPAPLREDWLRVVVLRRQVHLGPTAAGAGEVAWSCRWLVRGHWREQWFPSVGRHRPIFVLPYEKGPEDKPLKLPGATIFAVRR